MTNASDILPNIIDGKGVKGAVSGAAIKSVDPFDGSVCWSSTSADSQIVDRAVSAGRAAFPKWAALQVQERGAIITRFTKLVESRAAELAEIISRECGKPLWDSRTEVNSLVTKLTATAEAFERRATSTSREVRGLTSRTRFLPHGLMAVLGPFNFPMSMANSHIMPALYAGNTVVFKPSERTPLCGLLVGQIWQDAGLPPGVLNVVSGGSDTGQALVQHPNVDGVLFIGSHRGGLSILRALVDHPEKIVALEMGGNSPLVVWDYDDVKVAAYIALQSSIISSGQRCSAARRLIIPKKDTKLLDQLTQMFKRVKVGHYKDSPEPFYGPLIRPQAADILMARAAELVQGGAVSIIAPKVEGPIRSMVTPGLLDVTTCKSDADEEVFGPLLKVIKVDSFEEAIAVSNKTKFGLAAGVVTRDRKKFDRFFSEARAGIVNWNQQLTGATTFAPFGGTKNSGNYRPAGYLSVDYCSYAVASFEVDQPKLPDNPPSGLTW